MDKDYPRYYGIWRDGEWEHDSSRTPIAFLSPAPLFTSKAYRLWEGRVAVIPPDGGEPTEFVERPKAAIEGELICLIGGPGHGICTHLPVGDPDRTDFRVDGELYRFKGFVTPERTRIFEWVSWSEYDGSKPMEVREQC